MLSCLNMPLVVNSEGDPIQDWSAILVDEDKDNICDVLHAHVKYPYAVAVAAADRHRTIS